MQYPPSPALSSLLPVRPRPPTVCPSASVCGSATVARLGERAWERQIGYRAGVTRFLEGSDIACFVVVDSETDSLKMRHIDILATRRAATTC